MTELSSKDQAKLDTLDRGLYYALTSRGFLDKEILEMSAEEMFDEYCNWNGLIGWGPDLRSILETAKDFE